MRRQPTAEIDEFEINPAMGAGEKHPRRMSDGAAPSLGVGLPANRRETTPEWPPTEPAGSGQQIGRHMRLPPEFARQRPLGTSVLDQQPAKDLRSWCLANFSSSAALWNAKRPMPSLAALAIAASSLIVLPKESR
jgi:hypothetical protein